MELNPTSNYIEVTEDGRIRAIFPDHKDEDHMTVGNVLVMTTTYMLSDKELSEKVYQVGARMLNHHENGITEALVALNLAWEEIFDGINPEVPDNSDNAVDVKGIP